MKNATKSQKCGSVIPVISVSDIEILSLVLLIGEVHFWFVLLVCFIFSALISKKTHFVVLILSLCTDQLERQPNVQTPMCSKHVTNILQLVEDIQILFYKFPPSTKASGSLCIFFIKSLLADSLCKINWICPIKLWT